MAKNRADGGLFWYMKKAKSNSQRQQYFWAFAIVGACSTIDAVRGRLHPLLGFDSPVEEVVCGQYDRARGLDYTLFTVVSPLGEVDLTRIYGGNIMHHRGLPDIISKHLRGEDIRRHICRPPA